MPINTDIAANFPAELIGQRHWCVYRDDEGKKKVPFQARNPKYRLDNTNRDQYSTFLEAVACFQDPANHMDGIGYVFVEGVLGLDIDGCLTENEPLPSKPALVIINGLPRSYTERSPGGDGLHIIWRCNFVVDPAAKVKCKLPGLEGAEVYTQGRYFTVTGDEYNELSRDFCELSEEDAKTLVARVKAHNSEPTVEVRSRHDELNKFGYRMYKAGASDTEVEYAIRARNKRFSPPKDEDELKRALKDLAKDFKRGKITPEPEIDPDSWRDDCKSFAQLSDVPRRFALSQLIPMKALTALCGASFNGKTWIALGWGRALSTGAQWLRFFPSPLFQPIKCIYHVPEMDEALVREYMAQLKFEESENFLVRPMECSLWSLNDPRMLRSSEDRVVFLDTAGYFNPSDDSSNYAQSLRFAMLVHNLLQNGALAVVGLFHPPKYAKQEGQVWTLENSVLGSAGYGGMLRSCIRVQNLNADLNDEKMLLYCQGMKNPGLQPFQLSGPPPLKLKCYPSPYLPDLLVINDPRAEEVLKGFADGKTYRTLQDELGISASRLSKIKKQSKRKTKSGEAPQRNLDEVIPSDFVKEIIGNGDSNG